MNNTIEQILKDIDNEMEQLSKARECLLKKAYATYDFGLFMKEFTGENEELEIYIKSLMRKINEGANYSILLYGDHCSGKTTFITVMKGLFPNIRIQDVELISEPYVYGGNTVILPIYNSISEKLHVGELILGMDEILLSDYENIREWMYGK